MTAPSIWAKTQSIIEEKIGTTARQAWFDPIKPELKEPNQLILEMPDAFFKEWFYSHYLGLVKETIKNLAPGIEVNLIIAAADDGLQQEISLSDITSSSAATKTKIGAHAQAKDTATFPSNQESHAETRRTGPNNINPRYSFDNFVVGPSNRFANAAALAIVDAPAKAYNPLSIYGGVGLGKTHLMQAICLALYKKNPRVKICYTSSERFTTELINAILHHSTASFRAHYRTVDVLLVDDIQFLAGKESTQEEFFHTFNTLYDTHKQIIISSDRPAKEITNLQERLTSRFSWGLMTDIQPPDLETRVAILRKKLEREPIKVPDDVVFYIAERIKTNIRELEGALIRVVAYSLLEEKEVSLLLAQDVLKDMVKESKKIITVELIQGSVAEFFNISITELKNKKRNKNVVFPRQIAMHLIRELTNLSLPDIGEVFGGKDHTTVLYACNKIKKDIPKNKNLSDIINKLAAVIQT